MQILIISAGTIALITGLILITAPKILIKAGEFVNRTSQNQKTDVQRKLIGIVLILLGWIIIYSLIWQWGV